MAFVLADFRTNFPEFSDTTKYPDPQVTFWAGLATIQLPQCIWGNTWDYALQLYVAHEITIAAQNAAASVIGGSPGQSGGIANSKAVGAVNVGYDSALQSEAGGGWWNRTTYGQQLYRLIKIFGAKAVQL